LLGYYQPDHGDSRTRYRDIEVAVDVPGAIVLARSGYYVPEERKLLPESIPNTRWRQATPAESAK
jgi:hypothetical protein